MSDGTYVGADACPAGWLVTVIENQSVVVETYGKFSQIRDSYAGADRILVDIPIGLPAENRRRCDEQARSLLGCRGNSVFYPPCESAVACDDYDEANSAHRDSVGNGLSQQAFHIGDKIRDVESVVGDRYDGIVRESHPELCFAALNGQPIAYSKSSKLGRGLRQKLLLKELDIAGTVYNEVREKYTLRKVRRDDILDSIVLAVAARNGGLTAIPSDPNKDEPRIYYPDFDPPSLTTF